MPLKVWEVKCSKETGSIEHLQMEREIEAHEMGFLEFAYRFGTFDRRWGRFDEVFLIAEDELEARRKAHHLNQLPFR